MYESYFNLVAKPFDLLPNPDFLFLSKSHKRAASYLDYGIRERVGFILLTGEVGSGKTTIIRNLIRMNLHNVVLSKIFNTRVDSEQLIAMINDDFGLSVQDKSKIIMLRELNDFLIDQYIKGNKPVLIIDEAQNLSPDLLEEIRMLSNLETDNAKLLQIILVGQPELRSTLASPAMVQLRQRISISCHIRPLSRFETALYILHRLEMAGNRDAVSFPPETIDIIYKNSRGIPRLINIICDYLMISAFAEETKAVNIEMVNDVIDDLDFDNHFWGERQGINCISEECDIDDAEIIEPLEMEVSSLIRDISVRLDNLDRESGVASSALFQKIETLEKSLSGFKMETYAHISELQKNLVSDENAEKSADENGEKCAELCSEENKKVKAGFFRRIMGGGALS
jgi:putative secretion ATPase (PEP-CTERM system associated)